MSFIKIQKVQIIYSLKLFNLIFKKNKKPINHYSIPNMLWETIYLIEMWGLAWDDRTKWNENFLFYLN